MDLQGSVVFIRLNLYLSQLQNLVVKMCLQYMCQVSQLGAAEPRGFVKPAASAAGKTLSVHPAASLGMAMTQCA